MSRFRFILAPLSALALLACGQSADTPDPASGPGADLAALQAQIDAAAIERARQDELIVAYQDTIAEFEQNMSAFTTRIEGLDLRQGLVDTPRAARVEFINTAGLAIGEAMIWQAPRGVIIRVSAQDLPAGFLGFHIHETGVCAPGDGFTSAGGHVMGGDFAHGLLHPEGAHTGDLPNLVVAETGVAAAEIYVPGATLDDAGPNGLLDADGSSLMIHQNVDDHISQPIGGAGPRIACGVITPE